MQSLTGKAAAKVANTPAVRSAPHPEGFSPEAALLDLATPLARGEPESAALLLAPDPPAWTTADLRLTDSVAVVTAGSSPRTFLAFRVEGPATFDGVAISPAGAILLKDPQTDALYLTALATCAHLQTPEGGQSVDPAALPLARFG